MSARRFASRWRSRAGRLCDAWTRHRETWQIEREIEHAVTGPGPVIIGPWLSEVGHEVLYWVPFVRWVQAAYRLPPERLIVVSRGGVASWYAGLSSRYVEVFETIEPGEYASAGAARLVVTGTGKQFGEGELDRRLLAQVREDAPGARALHPSLMYRLFAQFWSGHQPLSTLDRLTRYARLEPPAVDVSHLALPREYVAMKFHTARSLPDTDNTRTQVRELVTAVASRMPVVLLESGLALDEHGEFDVSRQPGVVTLRGQLDAANNLAVQTRVIAGARAFVGTCGGLAWLAPMLGVDTVAVLSDARLLHAHLAVARRTYHQLGAGRFSLLDLGALSWLGLSTAAAGVVESRS
jgi:hypothetical protein